MLHLVRHGRAAAGWASDPDPPLDDLGRQQAAQVSQRFADVAPMALLTSPLVRCQQTAAPLAQRWNVQPCIEPGVAEMPSPEGVAMADRVDWLRVAMRGTWRELGPRYMAYRDTVVATLLALPVDAVVFSHFIAINAAIGAATNDDRVVIRSLDNCSLTVIGRDEGRLVLHQAGHEADTLIR